MAEVLPTAPDNERTPAPIEVDETLVGDVNALLRDGQRGMVLNLVQDLHPADLAQLLRHLPPDTTDTLFGWLPEEQAGAVLPEMERARRTDLLEEMPPHQIVGLLDEISTDDAADVLGDLPPEIAAQVLPRLEDAPEVEGLLHFEEDTAGGLMEADFVAVQAGATVAEATEELRSCAEEVDPVYVLYVVDEDRKLLGLVDLKRLVLARADVPVTALMDTDIVTVEPDVDQEEVARIMERYDLVALPVVSAGGVLIGRITIDDVVDVIREEAEEDFQRASGIAGDEEFSASVFAISRGRLVWLLIGLVGAFLSGLVIRGFEGALEAATVLAVFIPIVMAMAGNAGIQSSAIAVQGLASGELWSSDVAGRLGKELLVALLNGAALAVALGLLVIVLPLGATDSGDLALTAVLSLLIVIVLATVLGAVIPLLLARVGIDPALA
ncbi:MAG: magnesium transporter, partial [Rhodothermales bacterium]|nr:magnesium transporter [Rhodothermales bacterium]